jgi:small ligand-binding sensory domain FIST
MTRFRYGHATHPNWRMATELALAQVEGRITQPGWARDANLGVVYLSAEYAAHADDIVALLEERTGVRDWAGTCGHAIVSTGVEYDSEPAIAIMLLDLPADSFRVFSGAMPPPLAGERTQSGALAAQAALIHADPATPDLAELIGDMAGKVGGGMMFGGSASGQVEPLIQVANQVLSGGLSGVVFSSEVDLRMRVTQGCSPLAGEHVISACQSNLIRTLDGRPALDVLLADLGVSEDARRSSDGETLLRALPAERVRNGLLVGLADGDAPPRGPRPGFGDYVVRNLVGIDPHNRLLAVAAVPQEGDRAVFCTRDAQAARADLMRICTELREELETDSLEIRGAIYVSCVARGRALFGSGSVEIGLLQSQLGEFPLVGFFANGEIADHRLYGYTGVLALFTGPAAVDA